MTSRAASCSVLVDMLTRLQEGWGESDSETTRHDTH